MLLTVATKTKAVFTLAMSYWRKIAITLIEGCLSPTRSMSVIA
jgi:hypothetical protein